MALKRKRDTLLWFHAADISQDDVATISEVFDKYDVRFRKVVRDVGRDSLEDFDALGGDVPQRYLNQAALQGAVIYGNDYGVTHEDTANSLGLSGSGSDAGEAGTPSEPTPQVTQKTTTVAPPDAPSPTDAPTATKFTTSVPPPAN